jgi:hypothetical protein
MYIPVMKAAYLLRSSAQPDLGNNLHTCQLTGTRYVVPGIGYEVPGTHLSAHDGSK